MLKEQYTKSATLGNNSRLVTGGSGSTPVVGPMNSQNANQQGPIIENSNVQRPQVNVTGGEGLPPIQQLQNLATKDLVGNQGQSLLKVAQPFSPEETDSETGLQISELEGVKEILQGTRRKARRNRCGPAAQLTTQTSPYQTSQPLWLQPPPPPPYPRTHVTTSCERIVAEQRDIATRLAATLNHLQERVTYLYADHYGICSYLSEVDRSDFCKGKQQIQEVVTRMQRAQSTAQEATFMTLEAQFYKELHVLEKLHRKSKLNHLYGSVRY